MDTSSTQVSEERRSESELQTTQPHTVCTYQRRYVSEATSPLQTSTRGCQAAVVSVYRHLVPVRPLQGPH